LNLLSDEDLYYCIFKDDTCDIRSSTYAAVITKERLESLPDETSPKKSINRLSGCFSLREFIDFLKSNNLDDYTFDMDVRVYVDTVNKSLIFTDNNQTRKELNDEYRNTSR
jgi:hypothetical protein